MSGASSVHIPVFSLQPILPPVVRGEDQVCFAVTEANAGLNTTEIKTHAERRDNGYLDNGDKVWISTAQVANKMLLLARTTPLDKVKGKTEGLSLFYTSLDRSKIEVRLIHKMGRHAVNSNLLFIQDRPRKRRVCAASPRSQPRTHLGRRRSDWHRPRRHRHRHRPRPLRARAHCVQSADRHEPGHCAPARQMFGAARGGQPDG